MGGTVQDSLPLGQTGVIDAWLPPPLPPTIYADQGDRVLALMLALALAVCLIGHAVLKTPAAKD